MSSHARCNYCAYRTFVLMAEHRNHTATVRPAPMLPEFPAAVDVFIHPPDYVPPTHRVVTGAVEAVDGPTAPAEWWAGWFASLPTACCCRE